MTLSRTSAVAPRPPRRRPEEGTAPVLAGLRLEEAHRRVSATLAAERCPDRRLADLEARLLLCEATGLSDAGLIAEANASLSASAACHLAAMLARRLRGEPVSRILGRREFWGREFVITPAVLDPRPETETLVETALRLAPHLPTGGKAPLIVDAGVGSGAILVTLLAEMPDWRGIALDISQEALIVTMRNACRHGVADRLVARRGDWLSPLSERCDLLVSNPPYVVSTDIAGLMPEVREYDPRIALNGGPDGLTAYRRLASGAVDHVRPGGFVLLEVGAGQATQVQNIFANAGFVPPASMPPRIRDLAGIERAVLLQKR